MKTFQAEGSASKLSSSFLDSKIVHFDILYIKHLYLSEWAYQVEVHDDIIHNSFENKYNLFYSDTDSLVYWIQHEEAY